jgi:hypothetical protein
MWNYSSPEAARGGPDLAYYQSTEIIHSIYNDCYNARMESSRICSARPLSRPTDPFLCVPRSVAPKTFLDLFVFAPLPVPDLTEIALLYLYIAETV